MTNLSRRGLIAAAAGTALAAGPAGAQAPSPATPVPERGGKGADILGPKNAPREAEDPYTVAPPTTDHGTMPNLKWSFADSHMRLETGGWARQTTTRELPISKAMAGVNMRLKANAVREMHWHKEAEWAYMIKGRARITAVDQDGRTFADDVGEGDLWYFPSGIPHSIQGLEGPEDGCEFLLVFDDGGFSEDSTFLITDWLAHTPRDILAKNFGLPENAFDGIPEKELYIFPGPKPGPLADDKLGGAGPVPKAFSHRCSRRSRSAPRVHGAHHRLVQLPRLHHHRGGARGDRAGRDARVALAPERRRMAVLPVGQGPHDGVRLRVEGAHLRLSGGRRRLRALRHGHYIENTGTETLTFLEMFKSPRYADVSLTQWMALTPHALVQAHTKMDRAQIDGLPTQKHPVVPG